MAGLPFHVENYGATLVSKLRRGTHLYMKGYTFCCGGIYFYLRGANFYGGCIITKGSIFVLWVYFLLWRDILLLGGGAFLWRGYGYCYEGMYFCVRDILLLEGGTLRQRHKHNYFGVALGPRLAINEVHACAVYHLCTWKKVVSEKDSQAKRATSSVR